MRALILDAFSGKASSILSIPFLDSTSEIEFFLSLLSLH
jgi:hypothetical protein